MAETNYIPLSRNLLMDPKVKALQKRYGKAEGVGHWAVLLLELYAAGAKHIDMRQDYLREAVMDDHGMDMDELYELLDLCATVGLIDPLSWTGNRQLCNTHVNEQKQEWAETTEKRISAGRKGGKASGASRKASSNASSSASSTREATN